MIVLNPVDKEVAELRKVRLFIFSIMLVFNHGLTAGTSEFSLDNGMRIIIKEDHRAPVVVTQIWYKVGGSYEHAGITGISHVLEHMMFKGTGAHPTGEFSRIIAANGGNENAFTGNDYTAYFQTLEKSRLPISFELEADRMQNLKLTREEFAKEIEVVKEERRLRTEDSPQAYMYEVTMATSFQTSPYRYPIVGWMSDLEKMGVDDLQSWYRQWYEPNNATLVVAGDVDPHAVYRLAQQYFGPVPRASVPRNDPLPEVPQHGIKRVTVKRPAEVPSLLMGYKAPVLKTAIDYPDQVREWEPYALDVLAGVLDGGDSARFNARLVRGREVAAGIGAGYSMTDRLDNLFTISATPSQGNSIAELEQAIRTELEQLKHEPVDDKELDRVKAQVVSQDVYQRDSVFYQAMVIGMLETVGLPWKLSDKYVERIQAVTADQVRAVAEKYLVDDGLTVAELVPLPMDKSTPRPVNGGNGHVR
jgi:zinc protease